MMKNWLMSVLAGVMVAPVSIAETDVTRLAKNIEIMENILETAIKQDTKDRKIRNVALQSTYLDGQGVLFDVTTSGHSWFYDSHSNPAVSIVIPPIPPVPSIGALTAGGEESVEFQMQMEAFGESVGRNMEHFVENYHQDWEQLHKVQSSLRDTQWELREIERQMRDYDFELRHADKQRKKEIDNAMKELNQRKLDVSKKVKTYTGEVAELEQNQKRVQEENQKKRQAEVDEFLKAFESAISDVLCAYGSGLKALPAVENVSFRIKNIVPEKNSKKARKDKIYVFTKKKVDDCVREKLSKKQFMAEGKSYVF